MGRGARLVAAVAAALLAVAILVGAAAAPAEAHVLPTTTVVMDVHDDSIDAALRIPLNDLEAASGIDLGDDPAFRLAAERSRMTAYLVEHFRPTSTGADWAVTVDDVALSSSAQLGTGTYATITAIAHLVPSTGSVPRTFRLGYDAVIHRDITHAVLVSVRTDWSSGRTSSAHEVGLIQLDPVTNTVPPLTVDLGSASTWQGFTGMVSLGASHIREGTDHQLFLLTLLLPAPLLARRRRWAGPVGPGRALRRIASITLAFTLGHSATLALGALGLPAPQRPVEALIAVSILVAAVHAVRPIFAGREALVAAAFGLVHGLAFSATLSELDLSGKQLVVSLLGFNLGIELMQLLVVALVLPPLCVLARARGYHPLRVVAATVTGVAASGWLLARLGTDNPVGTVADGLAGATPWVVAALWAAALAALVVGCVRRAPRQDGLATSRPLEMDLMLR